MLEALAKASRGSTMLTQPSQGPFPSTEPWPFSVCSSRAPLPVLEIALALQFGGSFPLISRPEVQRKPQRTADTISFVRVPGWRTGIRLRPGHSETRPEDEPGKGDWQGPKRPTLPHAMRSQRTPRPPRLGFCHSFGQPKHPVQDTRSLMFKWSPFEGSDPHDPRTESAEHTWQTHGGLQWEASAGCRDGGHALCSQPASHGCPSSFP